MSHKRAKAARRKWRQNQHGVDYLVGGPANGRGLVEELMQRIVPEDVEAEDRAMEHDAQWFAEHPGERYRIRRPLPREFRAEIPEGCAVGMVEVFQIRPGLRTRNATFVEIQDHGRPVKVLDFPRRRD